MKGIFGFSGYGFFAFVLIALLAISGHMGWAIGVCVFVVLREMAR